ncbi:MAG TPA: hypothetical protein VHB79_21520 [Polyangiaceae bacterium]|nr:hypothetical protein [Polyangiaceae bacterium]
MAPQTAAIWQGYALALAAGCVACTTLGPMPAMTGVPPAPLERPGAEVQAAIVPGYNLSQITQSEPKADALPQLLALLEPDELLGVPGLTLGGRYAGESKAGASIEPLLGYRRYIDDDKIFSIAAFGFGTYASANRDGADYKALRGGLELGSDARITPRSRWAELHGNVGFTLTALDAEGHYCLDADRVYGSDCPDPPPAPAPVGAKVSGVFPTGHTGLSLDFGRHLQSTFHGVRLALDVAGGSMPTLRGGEQHSTRWFGNAGLSLTLGLGSDTGSGFREATAR